jgi:thymidylate synthase (FAD)
MKTTITMYTPEIEISNNAKICYGNEKNDKDITSQLVHGHGHLAALRFAYATVSIEGISVACQNQLVRSKHLDFMVQSKRYVNHNKGEFDFIMPEGLDDETKMLLTKHWDASLLLYKSLINSGVKKEDARSILPANTSTKMNVTGNLQAWFDFFKLRLNSHAQIEIRNVANSIYDKFSKIYPKVFTEELKDSLK